jgi:hypothetical protein
VRFGPDASRYLLAGSGQPVAQPFHLRVLWPWVCRDQISRWRFLWGFSWFLLAGGMFAFARAGGNSEIVSVASVGLLLGLPGVLGPTVVRPVGVDLPTMALNVWAAAAFLSGWWWAGILILALASLGKETSPLWVALWVWSPVPLLLLMVPAIVHLLNRPEMDPVTNHPALRRVHDHPIRSAFEHRKGRWRDAWLMVAPWGVCLAALYAPTWQLVAVLVVAYAQLLVATDTVRIYTVAAAPVMAVAAAQTIPTSWLLFAVIFHVVWWRRPEFV